MTKIRAIITIIASDEFIVIGTNGDHSSVHKITGELFWKHVHRTLKRHLRVFKEELNA